MIDMPFSGMHLRINKLAPWSSPPRRTLTNTQAGGGKVRKEKACGVELHHVFPLAQHVPTINVLLPAGGMIWPMASCISAHGTRTRYIKRICTCAGVDRRPSFYAATVAAFTVRNASVVCPAYFFFGLVCLEAT